MKRISLLKNSNWELTSSPFTSDELNHEEAIKAAGFNAIFLARQNRSDDGFLVIVYHHQPDGTAPRPAQPFLAELTLRSQIVGSYLLATDHDLFEWLAKAVPMTVGGGAVNV